MFHLQGHQQTWPGLVLLSAPSSLQGTVWSDLGGANDISPRTSTESLFLPRKTMTLQEARYSNTCIFIY